MVIKSNISHSPMDEVFQLSPLAACIRVALAGSLLIAPMATANAHDVLPTLEGSLPAGVTVSEQGNVETINLGTNAHTTLNWKNFDVGAGDHVNFIENGTSTEVLNRIFEGSPSEILGTISANGQIYLYNQNGFVFGQGSDVEAHALVATNLYISDQSFAAGITQQSTATVDQPALGNDNSNPATAVNKASSIIVQNGAKIHAVGNDDLVVLAGPNVQNSGSISTDNFGQVILVASQDRVYIQPADPSSPFHGMVVEVDTGGKVTNAAVGDIFAKQGNITMQGFVVNQDGRLTATTSVNENGSIRLLAEESHVNVNGKLTANQTVRGTDLGDGLGIQSAVNMGAASLSQILPDTNNTAILAQNETATKVDQLIPDYTGPTAIDGQAQPQSLIQVVADKVDLQGNGANQGATIVAPGAEVNIIATANPTNIDPVSGNLTNLAMNTSANAGRVLLEQGASIDVSGMQNIQVAMARNSGAISVESFDLRDSPLQKSGPLLGSTVYVDLRQPTSIVDISGAEARIARAVEERMGVGGTVNISSDGDVLVSNHASINISGGSVDYLSGNIQSTDLVDQYGNLVNISQANPNQIYTSVNSVTQYEPGYVSGLNAGAVNIVSPKLSWNGELQAGAVSGPYQRDANTAPVGGSFNYNVSSLVNASFFSTQTIEFASAQTALQFGINDLFPSGNASNLVFSQDFVSNSGLQSLNVQTFGNAIIDQGVTLQPSLNLASPGTLSIQATNIDVEGNIYLPGGNVNLSTTALVAGDGTIKVSKYSTIDVSGRWVNDYQQGGNYTLPNAPINNKGGNVKINAQGDVFLNAGSVIKADGGAWNSANNTISADNGIISQGGSISLASSSNLSTTARLHLDGQLEAYGLSQGGTLTLNSSDITIAGSDIPVSPTTVLLTTTQDGNLAIAQNSGFGAINLVSNTNGSQAFTVTGDVHLHLTQQHRLLSGNYYTEASSSSMAGFSNLQSLASAWQQAGVLRNAVNLSLSGARGVVMEQGSSVIADNNATVSLISSSQGGVFVDGTIVTPGGNINITLLGDINNIAYEAGKSIWLGADAQLLATGALVDNLPTPVIPLGGHVLNGGNVSLQAGRGYVVLQQGSKIDVSGTSGTLDLPKANSAGTFITGYQPTTVGSDAGKISLLAASGMVLDGSMKAYAGSASNKNGQLGVTLSNSFDNWDPSNANDPYANTYILNITASKQDVLGSIPYGTSLDAFKGEATVTSQMISQGGFDTVSLTSKLGSIVFDGTVNLTDRNSIYLSANAIVSSASNPGAVTVNTAYFNVTKPRTSSTAGNTTPLLTGTSVFTSNSQWTDLSGDMVWNGFSGINLNSQYDLRGIGLNYSSSDFIGSMTTAANLNLSASQIYPTTLSQFSFVVDSTLNPNGTITISGNKNSANEASPLSADGSLSFSAAVINQDGVLKAPFGAISLDASSSLVLGQNSLTSVSGAGLLVPFGEILGTSNWLYPYIGDVNSGGSSTVYNNTSTNVSSGAQNLPIQNKQMTLNAPSINMVKGSVVDISGGGNLLAYEFETGIGGTNDYLSTTSPSYNGGFAVIPSLTGSSIMPSDPLQNTAIGQLSSSQQSLYQVGSSVYLSGGNGLAAGTYTILPARYALLPGAFLVTPEANSQNTVINGELTNGTYVVSGYYTDPVTGTRDALSSGFVIENTAQVESHSYYNIQTANNFFSLQAAANGSSTPLLPMDSGQLSIIVQSELLLQGTINSSAATDSSGVKGRGAKVDISAANIDVVNTISSHAPANELQILASNLNGLGLDSLFLGGTRSRDNVSGEITLNVSSDTVTFEKGVDLLTKDLLVAANSQIEVKSGAVLAVSQAVNIGDSVYNVQGNGALLRVSGDQQVTVNRTGADGTSGNLLIDAGSSIGASVSNSSGTALQSIYMGATDITNVLGNINMQGGSLSLNANGVDLGEVASVQDNALKLTNTQLANLNVDTLLINSSNSIDFYGNVGHVAADGSVSALQFNNLTLNASGFSGFNNAGKVANIQANNLTVQNPSAATSPAAGNGTGQLMLSANSYTQGAGNFAINGFNTTTINVAHQSGAGSAFTAKGVGTLQVAGDLNVNADYLTATGGANLTIDASGHQANFNRPGDAVQPQVAEYGGQIAVVADGINFNTQAVMPSGKLGLEALKYDVTVGANAQIDLAGRADYFADSVQYTSGGTFSAIADAGTVHLLAGSLVDLNAGGGNLSGGTLILKAPSQSIDMSGKIDAVKGSVQLDQASYYGTGNFDTLMASLAAAGINNSVAFRSRDADIVQATGQQVVANSITLAADNGSINLGGLLNANGGQGGTISLYADNSISLANGSQLLAKGSTGNGGTVLLSSLAAGRHAVSVQQGSSINVGGAAHSTGGLVTLRALRNGTGVNIDPVLGTVSGYSQFYAEAVQQYTNTVIDNNAAIDGLPAGNMGVDFINQVQADTANYIENAQVNLGTGIVLRAGVEIDYTGSLTLATAWDFYGWQNYTDANGIAHSISPGDLVIRATDGLAIQNSLSDGFAANAQGNVTIQSVDSWSYQLVSGADLGSANTLATIKANASANDPLGTGLSDLTIGNTDGNGNDIQTFVRTGDGNITLASGGNIVLLNQDATVFIGGRQSATDPYGTIGALLPQIQNTNISNTEYPVDGGNLNVVTDNNIVGAVTDQIINNPNPNSTIYPTSSTVTWMNFSGGTVGPTAGTYSPTLWGINFSTGTVSNFAENFGSFGGGNVNITAGGNISDLSVIMPTTGKQEGQANSVIDGQPVYDTNVVQVNGGGQLAVNAGGNISGGVYYLGQGSGTITSGGQINGSSNTMDSNAFIYGPQLFMGNSNFTLAANSGVSLTAVSDPMIAYYSNFFSYTSTSGINVSSLSGDVQLGTDNSIDAIANGFSTNLSALLLANVYPASLQAVAFGGSTYLGSINLFPSKQSTLNIFARDNISASTVTNSSGSAGVNMYDIDPTLLPNAYAVNFSSATAALFNSPNSNGGQNAPLLHSSDTQIVRVVTQKKDINQLQFYISKPTIVQSGRDINDINLTIQNIKLGDMSVVSAGRDIIDHAPLTETGQIDASISSGAQITIAGPGELLVKSGRNIDLGVSAGIISVGNSLQPNLPYTGASLTVLAGLNNQQPDYVGFINYLSFIDYLSGLNYSAIAGLDTPGLIAYLSTVSQSYNLKLSQSELASLAAFMEKEGGYTYSLSKPSLDSYVYRITQDYATASNMPAGNVSVDYSGVLATVTSLIGDFVRTLPGDNLVTDAQALVIFAGLSPETYVSIQPQLDAALSAALYNQLILTGSAASNDPTVGNSNGFASVDALFPGTNKWNGNLSLVFSSIQTQQGGDINLMVPGGSIDAGLPFAFPGLNKDSSSLGILALQQGNINTYVSGDFEVNQSRVFTQEGGDITIWSSTGNVDAGRGAKSALSVPQLVVTYPNDNKNTLIQPAVAGSGIRAAANFGLQSGNVFLFAPGGAINAGEAGIGGNNITLAGQQVNGANNIQSTGGTTGAPAAPVNVGAALSGASSAGAGTTQAAQSSIDLRDSADASNKKVALGELTVEVLATSHCKEGQDCKNKVD